MRPRMLVLVAAGAVAAVAALVVVSGRIGSDTNADAASEATARATVARRDLVQRSTVSGSLGYADTRELVTFRRGRSRTCPKRDASSPPAPSSTASTSGQSSSWRVASRPGARSPRG
jgi:hypothetical protein